MTRKRDLILVWFTLAISSLATSAVGGESQMAKIKNGIYQIGRGQSGQEVKTTKGQTVRLRRLLTEEWNDTRIISLSNHNHRFRMTVRTKRTLRLVGLSSVAVYADGVCEEVHSRHFKKGQDWIDLTVDIEGRDNAKAFAIFAKTKVKERRHPGHRLLVRLTPKKKHFRLGQPVVASMEIKNVGSVPIHFLELGESGIRTEQFRFLAYSNSESGKAVPEEGGPFTFQRINTFRTLNSGESLKRDIDLAKWFRFPKEDTYEITSVFRMFLQDSKFKEVIWDDHAVGRCRVIIGPPNR